MEREALLYERLPGSRVRCHVCQWRCVINPGKSGLCRVRTNRDGVLIVTNYGAVSSLAVDPIEKKPLFHFFPGTSVLSLGGWGCNFHCVHCQNWEIACTDAPGGQRYLSPEEEIRIALRERCAGVAWTYNEPAIWLEYTLDSARLARENGLYTVYVTNGFMTAEALDLMAPVLDAWRVDVKAFSDAAYRRLANVRGWRGILEVAERAKTHRGMHVEVVTNVIPGLNDDDEQLDGIARWISSRLGELTPWHVTRFFPMHRLLDVPATPLPAIRRAVERGRLAGLKFVYAGNVHGEGEDTVCYSCKRVIVRRMGYHTDVLALRGSRCANCGSDVNFRPGADSGAARAEPK